MKSDPLGDMFFDIDQYVRQTCGERTMPIGDGPWLLYSHFTKLPPIRGKYIVAVSSDGDAEEMCRGVREINENWYYRVHTRSMPKGQKGPFPLVVRTIHAIGPINLSIRTAVNASRPTPAEEWVTFLRERRDCWMLYEETLESFDDAIASLSELPASEATRRRTFCGHSYRVSYFDPDAERRRQTPVGDVLVIVAQSPHQDPCRIEDPPRRKSRSDGPQGTFVCTCGAMDFWDLGYAIPE